MSHPWWRGAAIYQIYPRSFQDSNHDGTGDLPGITRRLPYLASLGVDAVWISPFFPSPMRDFGYDVTDYCGVDPRFGTLEDFDRLVQEARAHGLKILIDLVLSHTSSDHPWFVESRSSYDNAKADWYVWADAKPDGTPPNNWLSIFGGSAWQWDTRRQQYFLHNFLTSQPDLNYHNPQVQDAALEVAKFWLRRGVGGFRLDVVNFYFHDPKLRDNPPQPPGHFAGAVPRSTPYARQRHLYDKSQPENLAFLQRLRALLDCHPDTTSVGEIGDDEPYAILSAYTTGGRLHMAYIFELLEVDCAPRHIHGVLDEFLRHSPDTWACWSLGNHDVTRVLTRWRALGGGARLGPLLLALLGSLRGSICVFQGEELGLTQATIPYEALQDPFGKEMWPEFPGRDGCRTPMPWEAAHPHGGFTDADPWLPIPPEHLTLAVDAQDPQPDSTLNRYRAFLRWRRAQPALLQGDMSLLSPHDQVVAFTRGDVLCAFNLSERETRLTVSAEPLEGHGFAGRIVGEQLVLPPHDAFFGRMT